MPVQLILKALNPPSVNMTRGKTMFTINGGVEFDVIHPNRTTANAFTLGVVSKNAMTTHLFMYCRTSTLVLP